MSVYPEFLQHIHDEGLYVHGYNYEAMYNIMVYTITYNVISTNNFIYTYNQMNNLYEFTVTDGKPKIYDNHFKIKYKKLSEEINIMTYDEFINYLYAEGYIDEKPKQTKHK